MDKLITKIDNIFKEPEQYKKIVFFTPKMIRNEPILFEFCNFNPTVNMDIINAEHHSYIYEELNNNVIPLLNNYKRLIAEQQQFTINNNVWDYITLLHKTRKIILNNSQLFKYSTIVGDDGGGGGVNNVDDKDTDEVPSLLSSSLDFELTMILYMLASKEQSLVDDNLTDSVGTKKNAIHLINAKICLEEAYLISKDCHENLDNIVQSSSSDGDNNNIKPYDMLLYKKHINDIKTDHISNEDSNQFLIKSNISSCSDWIKDIGGLELMKARYQIAYCQANENFYKAIKNSSKDTFSKLNISFSIADLYKEIISKNGTLGNDIYNDNNIKKFSKFMYYYWIYNAHKIVFKSSSKEYCNSNDEDVLTYYENINEIPLELNRYTLLTKYYNKLMKIITNNKNLNSFSSIINKKKESIELNYNNLINLLTKWSLALTPSSEDINFVKYDPLYCTSLSNKIQFKSFIDISLTRLQKNNNIKKFIDFCDNKPSINVNIDGDGDMAILKEKFKNHLTKWDIEHSSIKNNHKFILGKIDSDLKWMIFFISLFENDKTISDNKSYEILKSAINKFIVSFEKKK
jgi:hypothetical protein